MATKKTKIFASNKVDPELLQNTLWETLQAVKNKKVDVKEANSIIAAAKEICNIARLELQVKVLTDSPNRSKQYIDYEG